MKKLTSLFSLLLIANLAFAQQYSPVVKMSTQEAMKHMMDQLGIQELRPGASSNPDSPNYANYDESKANPCPELPPLLTSVDGQEINTAEEWWSKRRPELLALAEQEIYGKIPQNVPDVNWEVKIVDREFVGRTPVIAKELVGHVDNSSYPLVDVNIKMMLVVPTNVKGPVPVLMMFGRPKFPAPAQPNDEDYAKLNETFRELMIQHDPSIKETLDKYPAYAPLDRLQSTPWYFSPPANGESPGTEQLLAAGWGYCTLLTSSVQADNHEGLTEGIIGLVNKGQPRSPEDWGALRAWSWGAARGLDYLETDSLVDAKKVGIEGVSRYGKAALVTMALEPRFAVGLIGSSGKGGVTLHRRVFGEAVENLTGGANYWMAGNYMKYGAEKSDFAKMTGCDLPLDSHSMIALCAPRPLFISYGIPEKGDALWLDQKGSYMATVAAGEVYKLLGAKDIGVTNDYLHESMPPVLESLLDGQLGWRQHDGGHTDQPNFQHFIPWASRELGYEK
ncbi:alpha/beta hydrolase family protein [Jiulongibacter sp. NS-SX5]|uniref:alpha/beta hydrolase family protein n=1 Tax=Jiulongibacter sp. NS-SX5 TaxID=3463854 RepID=UPI004059F3DD